MDGRKTQYWGLPCSVCRIMIPLAIIAFTPERKVIPIGQTTVSLWPIARMVILGEYTQELKQSRLRVRWY